MPLAIVDRGLVGGADVGILPIAAVAGDVAKHDSALSGSALLRQDGTKDASESICPGSSPSGKAAGLPRYSTLLHGAPFDRRMGERTP